MKRFLWLVMLMTMFVALSVGTYASNAPPTTEELTIQLDVTLEQDMPVAILSDAQYRPLSSVNYTQRIEAITLEQHYVTGGDKSIGELISSYNYYLTTAIAFNSLNDLHYEPG